MTKTINSTIKSTGIKLCRGCFKSNDSQHEIVCSVCEDAFHPKCAGMTVAAVQCVNQLTFFNWFCNSCGEKYGDCAANTYRAQLNSAEIDTTPHAEPHNLMELKELVLDCRSKIEALTEKCNNDDGEFTPVMGKRKSRRQKRKTSSGQLKLSFSHGNNLIIAGVPEPDPELPISDQSSHDLEVVSGLCQTLDINVDMGAKVIRLNKGNQSASHHALIRVEFSNQDIRKALLRNSKYLRNSALHKNVYVRPDMSPAELAKHKLLVIELKQRRGNGEDVVICSRSNKVILRAVALTAKNPVMTETDLLC